MKKTEDIMAAANERMIRVQRGVYAIGIAVVPDRLVGTFRTTLDEMAGMDWVDVPYSLARSIYDSVELYIIQKNIRTGGQKLIELDLKDGVLKVTPLGETALKKLGDKLDRRRATRQ